MDEDTIEQAIDEALNGKPRARDLAKLIEALGVRRETWSLERQAARTDGERAGWDERIARLDAQVAVLREEYAVTEFVERSVRFTLNRPDPED